MPDPSPSFRKYEFEEQLGGKNLLASQRAFIYDPARFSMIAGGFNSGKTFAVLHKGLILSAAFPGNVGAFLCFRGSDAETRLFHPFLKDICPPQWIRSVNQNKRRVVLRNGSVISFEHIKDSTSSAAAGTGTRRIGSNWGWFGISQAEEITFDHWKALISRLRLPKAKKKFGFGDMNPAGKDWLYDYFFKKVQPWPRDEHDHALPLDGKFYQMSRMSDHILGICVNSDENRMSNGGFIEDQFFDDELAAFDKNWRERFIYSSFDDFKGRLFNDFQAGLVDYNDASVHVVDDFQIPRHWQCLVAIDVGGDSPWACVPVYADEQGNLIVTGGFHNRTGLILDVARWIKRNTPYNETRTRFIIDPENPVATVELSEHSIHCNPAQKAIMPGLLRLSGYLHIQKHRELPHWYEETQPPARTFKFRGKGAPMMYVFKSAMVIRKELDTAKWDAEKPDRMYKSTTARFDAVEALRYAAMEHPEPSKAGDQDADKYVALEKVDRGAAAEWRALDRKRAIRNAHKKNALLGMDDDDSSPTPNEVLDGGHYDWEG